MPPVPSTAPSTVPSTESPVLHHLEVTVAHHGDNEFYMLGRVMAECGGGVLSWNAEVVHDVVHEAPPAVLFAALPNLACNGPDGTATCPEFCVILDACTADGDAFDDIEIDAETADLLLDGRFAERLATARGNLAEHYAYERRRPEDVSSLDWLLRLAAEKAPG